MVRKLVLRVLYPPVPLRRRFRNLEANYELLLAGYREALARAEAAEAKAASGEALADEWERLARGGDRMVWTNPLGPSLALRAALAEPTEQEKGGE